jgi:ankyrin repeat protein
MRLRQHVVVAMALVVLACRAEPDTPVGRAAASGDTLALETLLSKGGAPSVLDGARMAPLHWAARAGHVDAVRALLEAGVPVDQRDVLEGPREPSSRR